MEKLFTLQNQVAGDPIEIEITFRHPHTDQPIRIGGIVGIISDASRSGGPSNPPIALQNRLKRARQWERNNLPQWGSRVAQDLFRYFGTASNRYQSSTVKEIVQAMGYSERSIRNQLRLFTERGWIIRTQSEHDKRNAQILPTEQFLIDYAYWLMLHQDESV